MRLLELSANNELIFTKNFIGNIPEYAILSHTWGQEDDEVSFKDIRKKRGSAKPGYQKIVFCGKQAWEDGLRYFWVDTCCIDKSNSTELAEAINSMYKWYQNSARCYVYLDDVDGSSLAETASLQSFRESRWFQRGWTLQELISPKAVYFFSAEEKCIGSKEGLMQDIHEITGIPIRVLQGHSLSEFDVEERMLWAKCRRTTRPEDRAYSLLGIVGVFLPLIYGEGERGAFERLRREIHTRQDSTAGDPSANDPGQYLQPGQTTIVNRSNEGNAQELDVIHTRQGSTAGNPSANEPGQDLQPGQKTIMNTSNEGNVQKLHIRREYTVQHILDGHQAGIRAIAFSPDEKFLVSVSYEDIQLWSTQCGRALETQLGYRDEILAVAFPPYGPILDIQTGPIGIFLERLVGHESGVSAIAFSPDGNILASGSADKSIRLWDMHSGQALQTLRGHVSRVSAIAFSPNGKILASGSSYGTIRIWDGKSGLALRELDSPQHTIRALAFSPDSEILASGSGEIIQLWDPQSSTILQTLKGHEGEIRSIAFSPNGKVLASVSGDKTIRLWAY
jgi:hypothetical protein